MSLKELIKNQVIIIDDHKRGAREIKDYDNSKNDIHIDKETNFPINGKRQKLKIRIPINSDRPITIESKRKELAIPSKLQKEIRKSLEDKQIRNAFVGDILKVLANYDSVLNSEEKAVKVLRILSQHFDLKWDDETILNYKDEILMAYTQFYTDSDKRRFFIKLDKKSITIGENNGYTKQLRKYNP